ncbi:NADP-reducing hydrogenase subunit HndA [Thermanaeromonas toyohensis ToBE]|uniref:NADP-reducing hydrogenase subunit HndA n=1 Tax=Thermanaeromonas toyohensis ToBE TaxID=698762 RepID=A0A1W1W1E7_9FIRM|nr:NADH-quinone oxidoreductase subunit NuoE [Thermanaeromonas toyohensis]SMB98924.1 NADP-reducing hydrogenase subunit HndA [Thermanaeromonas toyohensis ToBE]
MQPCQCEEKWEQLEQIIDAHRGQPSALIEVLHQAQELIGYLPKQVQMAIADGLGVSLSEVYSVVSFYSHFTTKPKGKYQISVCKGTACYVKGSPEILERLEKELGIKPGDSTDDGRFSLEVVRCLGACGLGPVMMVNKRAHGLLKPDTAVEVLKSYK